ncbi:MAG: arylsulfatase [Verrucomicrobiales bacterium]|nr:arylsulfatase [Verrucomicrobiales bacterium]
MRSFVAILILALNAYVEAQSNPNIVIIFTDDQGYADVGCFGAEGYETPNLDKMASEGMRFTDFYVAQAVCGASRAALLTGCYPNRISMLGAPGPKSKHGINPDEILIPEMLKNKGYSTGMFGKWHLGHHKKSLPIHHGFDEYYGLPYSNDMWPHHPGVRHLPMKERLKKWPHLPLIEGDQIIDDEVTPEEQKSLTTDYTIKAVNFIKKNKDNPFFLYLAHSMPHVPLFVKDKNKGITKKGLYADIMWEIDWSVGEIIKSLKDNGIDENTLVIFTTDNGPWLSYGNHAGSAKPLREGKGTAWEGGVRVPCIMRWPKKIPSEKICSTPAMTIDILPTIAELTGSDLPNHSIDGKSIFPLMKGNPQAKSPHEAYFFYWGANLHAIRKGNWSLHLPHSYRSLKDQPGKDGIPNKYIQKSTAIALFDLKNDIGQKEDLSEIHPNIVERLKNLGEKHIEYVKKNKRNAARY